MSVLTYLEKLEEKLRLSDDEKSSIETSLNNLKFKLNNWFGTEISDIFVFGSYKRNTNLCRNADSSSDVDIMIVFKDFGYKPQTYINKLKTFMEVKYSSSEIYQSNPCAILELKHIKFELTPAIWYYGNKYKIPDKANSYQDWLITEPFYLDELAKTKPHLRYKHVTRLVKYWNCINNKYFPSYSLEQKVLQSTLYCYSENLKQSLFQVLKSINCEYNTPQYVKDYIDKTKLIISNVENYERQNLQNLAESEIKKLFKEL